MEQQEFLQGLEENKLPTGLNVLTILTFIGCAIALISGCMEFVNADKRLAEMQDLMNSGKLDKMPDFMKGMINEQTIELLKLQVANKVPMIIIGLLSTGLCFVGALQMRKQKMQGYYLWLIGEILPLIGAAIFISFAVFKGFGMIGLLFPLVFIILYTIHRKYLTK